MTKSDILNLDLLEDGGVNGELLHNSNIDLLESFGVLSVENLAQTTIPPSPVNGQRWVLHNSGLEAPDFTGHELDLALYFDGWIFYDVVEGMRIYDKFTNWYYIHNGTSLLDGIRPREAVAVADLNQNISPTPTIGEVQAISDKIDELLGAMRTADSLSN